MKCPPATSAAARCLAIYLACVFPLLPARTGDAAAFEPIISPTVHPLLTPATAIPAPLKFTGEQISVWRADLEQRMLLSGAVTIAVGYRQLRADNAAVWLTPSRESGEGTFDVAIYLSGHVEVREGTSPLSTRTAGTELLVTTRVSGTVQFTGTPISQSEEDSPIVKRGLALREQVLNAPQAPIHIPTIVITSAEQALQSGWIARGANNRIILGPGDTQLVRDAAGRIIPGATPPPPPKPRPSILAVGDDYKTYEQEKEFVTVFTAPYLLYDSQDGKPPIEFRANRMVTFSPKAAASQPNGNANEISSYVTGVYLEGDVAVDEGDRLMVRAERVYYDFTSQRAIMLDATLSSVDELRNVPIYMRAAEIRQLARGDFAAKKVTFSTSEFHTPHYHIGASEAYLQDVTVDNTGAPGEPGAGGDQLGVGLPGGGGSGGTPRTYKFQAKDATIDVLGVPIFYWPWLSGDTATNEIPLRTIRVSNSKTYGLSLLTDWDLFALTGQPAPDGLHADLNLDYFSKRGPATGIQADWHSDDDHGFLRSYGLLEQGTDRLGRDRQDIPSDESTRGRATVRDQRDLGNGLTLQVEGSYISDPNFLEQFFQREFDTDKEQETSVYLKKQGETDALTLLGKFSLFDFTATADQIDDQYTTEKEPEIKYWRVGDSFFDLFTYYSESGVANLHSMITDFTPNQLGLLPTFVGVPAAAVPPNMTYRQYLISKGWTDNDIIRADTRQEIDMPLQIGDLKVVPYVTGRFTAWDDSFPSSETGNSTTRVWGGGGVRSSMTFWHVYDDAESTFFDVHRLRHIIEPQFNIFVGGSNVDQKNLQPFDSDVEGISTASGAQLSINQKWQTKRGGPGHWRDVDWITLNVSWNEFWNRDETGTFFPQDPTRGFFFPSRPELSLATNSLTADGTWRIGEHVRLMGEGVYGIDDKRIEQAAVGVAVDQSNYLSYFFGNRYIQPLNTDEWTVAADYHITKKYELIAAESYDFQVGTNILSSLTIIRRLPRFNTALTFTYDANNSDTSVVFTAWPEGLPQAAFGTNSGTTVDRR